MTEWYVREDRSRVNWDTDLPGGVPSARIYRLAQQPTYGERITLWAAPPRPVAAWQIALARAAESSDPVPAGPVPNANSSGGGPSGGTVNPATLAADVAFTGKYVQATGDIGGTAASPQVTTTHLAAPLPVAQGGTGGSSLGQGPFIAATDTRGTNARVAVYYVDPTKGSDSNDGLAWKRPLATIQAAINLANTAVQAATIVVSNDRHDVGSGLVIAKGQPVTITAERPRPLKYASPSVYSTIPVGCGPTLYSSTGAAALAAYSGNGNAYGGSFQSICFECTGAAQAHAIVALGVNAVMVDDCFFFFTATTPATATAIWAYNNANAAAGGDDSSWWRITRNWAAKAGLVKFGQSTNDTTAVQADANQNVIRDNVCFGRRVNPGDVVAPAIEINRGHRDSIADNNIELYTTGIVLRDCFQCSERGDGGEQVEGFVRLVKTRSTDLSPVGSSNAANIPNSYLVSLETTSVSNTINTAATTTVDSIYGTTVGAVKVDSTSPYSSQAIIATDAMSRPQYRVIPKTPVRSTQYQWCPEGGAFTTASAGQGVQKYVPFGLASATTITAIGIEVTTAGSTGSVIRLGVYADDGSGFPTGTPLLDAGTIDSTTTGFKPITGLTLALQRGQYHLSATGQGAPTTNPQVRCIGGLAPGVVPLSGPSGGVNCTGYQDAATVTGALGTANPNANATGPLIAVKFA